MCYVLCTDRKQSPQKAKATVQVLDEEGFAIVPQLSRQESNKVRRLAPDGIVLLLPASSPLALCPGVICMKRLLNGYSYSYSYAYSYSLQVQLMNTLLEDIRTQIFAKTRTMEEAFLEMDKDRSGFIRCEGGVCE